MLMMSAEMGMMRFHLNAIGQLTIFIFFNSFFSTTIFRFFRKLAFFVSSNKIYISFFCRSWCWRVFVLNVNVLMLVLVLDFIFLIFFPEIFLSRNIKLLGIFFSSFYRFFFIFFSSFTIYTDLNIVLDKKWIPDGIVTGTIVIIVIIILINIVSFICWF